MNHLLVIIVLRDGFWKPNPVRNAGSCNVVLTRLLDVLCCLNLDLTRSTLWSSSVISFHRSWPLRPSWTFSQIYTGSFMYYTLVVLVFWAQPFTKQFCLRVCTFLVFASGFLFHPKETRNDLNALDHLVLPTFHFVVQVSIMF